LSKSAPSLGFEDAIRQGIEDASRTIRHIKGAWIQEQVIVEDGKVTKFPVDSKVTFIVE